MIIKLFFILGIILLFFIYCDCRKTEKNYYFLAVLFLLIRELDVPIFGEVTPSGVMITLLFLRVFLFRHRSFGKWSLYFADLLFSIVIAFLLSPNLHYAFGWAFTLFVVMAFALLPPYLFDDENDLIKLVRCVIITSSLFSFAAIIAYRGFADGTIIISAAEAGEIESHVRNSRIYGLTSSNLVNCICAISIVLIPYARFKKKWIEWVIIVLIMYAGLITFKRVTLLAMIPSLIIYVIGQDKTRPIYASLIALGIVLVFFSWFGEEMLYRFEIAGFGEEGFLDDHSTARRYQLQKFAYESFLSSPLFGHGSGCCIYIHNGFLEVLANCGIIGVICIVFRFFPSIKDIKALNPWALAVLVFLVSIFFLESAINHVQIMAYLGVYLGGYYVSKNYNLTLKR